MKLHFIYIHRVYIPTYWLHQFLFSQNMLLESYFFCVSHIRQSGEVIRSKTIVRGFFHCFIHYLAPCFSFVFQFALQLVLFLTGTYNFYFPLFAGSFYCTLFLQDCFDFTYICVCVCVFHYFDHYLPDFVTAICLGFISSFSFLSICFNLT